MQTQQLPSLEMQQQPQQLWWDAIHQDDVAALHALLTEGTLDVDARNKDGQTALHVASRDGRVPVVELLLAAHADPNATDKYGRTPLHMVAWKNEARIGALLLQAHADPHATDNGGDTALHDASLYGYSQLVELLLQAHANPNAVNTHGRTPLYMAALHSQALVVDLLLQAGADANAADELGTTALHLAAWVGHAYNAKLLLRAKAHPNALDKKGETPLHVACRNHHADVARALLTAGASLHGKDSAGLEPFTHAIRKRQNEYFCPAPLQFLQVLVSFGASWDAECQAVVDAGRAWKDAPAFRVCLLLWAQERTDGLPFTQVPVEVVRRGAVSTKAYIHQLQTSDEVVLRRKICLVGPSCAGKTSFARSITSQQPQLVHVDDRTIGVDHIALRFFQRLVSRRHPRIHDVTFWDFAGQDAYQVAHALFFSRRTLYFVFVDLEAFTVAYLQASIMSDVPKQETQLLNEFIERAVTHWIRLILTRQPDAEFVFIATKADLLKENQATERLLKDALVAKVTEVYANMKAIKRKMMATRQATTATAVAESPVPEESASGPDVVFVSCTSADSVQAARDRIEALVIQSDRSFQMPEAYSTALETIVEVRDAARKDDTTTRIQRVFAPVDRLCRELKLESDDGTAILQTLHDLGDALWYEDLGVELFQNTVILDPLLLIDFIRQVINHNHTGQILSHADLKAKAFWRELEDNQHMEAMKQVLQQFRLYHFEFGLPSKLFDHLIVASVSPYFQFDAGPDWILYEDKGIAACRILVGRDRQSLHRTIHVEAVVAEAATGKRASKLWAAFQQVCGALVTVLHEHPGLVVSSFAWDDDHRKISLMRLVKSPAAPLAVSWMPPTETWNWFKQLVTSQRAVA